MIAKIAMSAPTPEKEEASPESLNPMLTLIAAMPDGLIVLNDEGNITLVNAQTEALFGYRREEMLGKPFDMLLPERVRDILPRHVDGKYAVPITRRRGSELELLGRRKDGTEFPVDLSISGLETSDGNAAVAIVRDITERKIAEGTRQLQSAALNAAANAIVITGRSGIIEWVNPAFALLTGYSTEEAIGQTPRFLKSGRHDEEYYRRLWATILSGQIWRGEVINRRRDGSFYTEDETITPVQSKSGDITHFVAIKEDITERKRAEAALHLFRTLLDQSNDTIEVVDPVTGRFLDINEKGHLALGYSRDEFLALSVFDLDSTVDRSAFPTIVEGLRSSGALIWEGNHRRKDGTTFPVEVNIRYVQLDRDYVVAVVRDITERKQAEMALRALNTDLERRVEVRTTELRASEARYSTLFHSTDEGFCIIEMIFDEQERPIDYRFLEINPAFERQTGISNASGKRMREIAPDHEEHWFEIYGRVATSGKAIRFQNHAEKLNRYYDVYACRIGEAEERLVAILFNDITDKRQMESALVEAKERAELANLAKSEFLSRMSHELRTPLNAVLGFAQLLDLQYDDPKIKEATRSIMKGGKHLLEMINEVLDISRIESGNLAISVEPVSIWSVLGQSIGLLQPIADGAEVHLSIEGNACKEMHVQADRQRLLQVLVNLLSNAIKYNKPGGKVQVRCTFQTDGFCRIEVSDTGHGIPKEDQELLFQPFQRFGDHGVEGTGLGLALSEQFVALMGGRLGLAESTPKGSTFFIELKEAQPAHQELATPLGEALPLDITSSKRGTILCVEDNLSNMRLLEMAFTHWKYLTLIPAMQGLVGLELAREHCPDLILLDVHLPDLMGDQVLVRLKADPATRAIPVVILSADATDRQIRALLEGGAADYLTKPVDLERLFGILAQFLPDAD